MVPCLPVGIGAAELLFGMCIHPATGWPGWTKVG